MFIENGSNSRKYDPIQGRTTFQVIIFYKYVNSLRSKWFKKSFSAAN